MVVFWVEYVKWLTGMNFNKIPVKPAYVYILKNKDICVYGLSQMLRAASCHSSQCQGHATWRCVAELPARFPAYLSKRWGGGL